MADIERSSGWILAVERNQLGSVLVGDHAADATVLLLRDASDFNEDGGEVQINGVPLTYTEADWDDDTVTMEVGIVADLPAGTEVVLWSEDASVTAPEVVASVELSNAEDADSDPVEALVPLPWQDRLPFGIRTERAETVEVQRISVDDSIGRWEIVAVHGVELAVDASSILPHTLPDPEAGEAPAASPALVAKGLLESFMIFTEDYAIRDWLTLQVSDDGGTTWTDLPDMPIRGTWYSATRPPWGGAWDPGIVYGFRAIEGNQIDDAPPSDPVFGQLNTTAAAVVATTVFADSLFAGNVLTGRIALGGDRFTLTALGVDSTNPGGGLLARRLDGGQVSIPLDDGPVVVDANRAIINRLEVPEGLKLNGLSELRGTQVIRGETIPDPTEPPVVQPWYLVAPTYATLPTCMTGSADPGNAGGVVICDGTTTLREFTVGWGGAFTTSTATVLREVTGFLGLLSITRFDSGYLAAFAETMAASGAIGIRVRPLDVDLAFTGDGFLLEDVEFTSAPASFTVGTNDARDELYAVLESDTATVVAQYDPTDGTVVDADVLTAPALGPIAGYGLAEAAFSGAPTHFLQPRGTDMRAYTALGAEALLEEVPRPYGSGIAGIVVSGVNGHVFLDSIGRLIQAKNASDNPGGATNRWAYDWPCETGDHTTEPSPYTEFTSIRGAGTEVIAYPPPQLGVTGPHVADRVRILLDTPPFGGLQIAITGAGGTPLPVGVWRDLFGDTIIASGSDGHNNYAGVVDPGVVAAENGGFTVDGESNGSPGTGTFAELHDGASAPAGIDHTYLRFERDVDGDVQAVYLGTVD